jgi:hypothetical protein
LRHSIKIKNAKPEVTDRFQDGCRRHVVNSSECYKVSNEAYHLILMKIGTQTEKNLLSLKIQKRKRKSLLKMAANSVLEIEVNAIK